MEVVEWSVRLDRKRAFRVRCLLAPLSMMRILLQYKKKVIALCEKNSMRRLVAQLIKAPS